MSREQDHDRSVRSSNVARIRKRPYGNACIACRTKKRSCDGKRPVCSNCLSTNEQCVIPTPNRFLRNAGADTSADVSMFRSTSFTSSSSLESSISRLVNQIARIESRLLRIENGSAHSQRRDGGSSEEQEIVRPADPSEGFSTLHQHDWISFEDNSDGIDLSSTTAGTSSNRVNQTHRPAAKYRLTVDEAGNVTYHGVTGLNQGEDVPNPISSSLLAGDLSSPPFALPSLADSVSQNQALAPIFQALATSKHISIAPELGDALLNAYHCYEVFEITEQTSFLRDMVLGGPCYSELLLMVLYASASRMIDGLTEEQKLAQGDLFVKLAKAYLYKELEGPTKITTIQALLLLSSRECALGETSQGWNHAGLAFRMIQDLGIHHNPDSVSGVSNLSLEEQATRDRLFWAAFIWDKALSLALGREPTLPPRPGSDPSSIPAFATDDEPWFPFFAHPLNCPPALQGYIYPSSSRSVVFRLIAQLCCIMHDIIMGLYSNESRDSVASIRHSFVTSTRQRLDLLWSTVPEHMKTGPENPSPPPHIFMFLIFFDASYILLHRANLTAEDIANVAGPAKICLEHSQSATAQAMRFSRTFGEYMRYLPRYSWFVAASFDIVILDCDHFEIQVAALDRLSIWLRTMEKNLLRAPSIKRSVQHISSKIYEVLTKNVLLAQTNQGISVKTFLRDQRGIHGVPSPGAPWLGDGSFDFFDFLQNT